MYANDLVWQVFDDLVPALNEELDLAVGPGGRIVDFVVGKIFRHAGYESRLKLLTLDDVAGTRIELDEEAALHASHPETIDLAGAVELGNILVAAHLENARGFLASESEAGAFVARLGIDGTPSLVPQGKEKSY